jgi:hypothetical protein
MRIGRLPKKAAAVFGLGDQSFFLQLGNRLI